MNVAYLNTPTLRNSHNSSLEQEFSSKVQETSFAKIFKDFRYPNEPFEEEKLQEHLQDVKPGRILVTTGSERAFFTANVAQRLLRKTPENFNKNKFFFRGIVVLDINPQIKKYVDYNILLLRLARSKEEYQELSTSTELSDIKNYIEIRLEEEAANGNLPEDMKKYYLNNLVELHQHYHCFDLDSPEHPFFHQQAWRSESVFEKLKYWKKDSDFYPIHELAKSGNIIAITGDIQNLSFLKRKKISLIDISNIPEFIKPSEWEWKIENKTHPRILRTYLPPPYNKKSYTINSNEQVKLICNPEQIHFISYPYDTPLSHTHYQWTVDNGKTNTLRLKPQYYQPACNIS
ncbi:MAG: hypothetical protein K2Y01_00740 [Rhabdochlamydiaceae bacterium]|nr:hypothetical protein [Rhabdochlamydiaceae bacterium]